MIFFNESFTSPNDVESNESLSNANISLIISNIPLTLIETIQALVLYDRDDTSNEGTGDISQNTFDIGELKTQQGPNTGYIPQNTYDIGELKTQQGTNTGDISQNTFDIGELKTQQGTNTGDKSQNTLTLEN